jgi:phosphatidylserine/phosphatidylglycerophosphate/cardiolipin synthase-like enzyme
MVGSGRRLAYIPTMRAMRGRWALGIVGVALGLACSVESVGDDESRGPLGKADAVGSCANEDGTSHCGGKSEGNCWCNDSCVRFGDCCDDKPLVCDGIGAERQFEVILTDPHCDVCTAQDKEFLNQPSSIVERIVELADGATQSIDVAQFTFSVRAIENALVRAHERGVSVRVAINAAQDQPGTLARRLADEGIDVRFVQGRPPANANGFAGLQHAKFMLVDQSTLATGSNNWSSTGVTINEENTIVVQASPVDPMLAGFSCHFETMWDGRFEDAAACSSDDVRFTPGSGGRTLLRDQIRAAEHSVDVLMHHLLFDDLVRDLAQAAERGVLVRIVLNAADQESTQGKNWNRLRAAGGQIRYKQTNAAEFQIMHHKLAIFDDAVLVNGSGNWSGNAFFNNYENYVRYREFEVVEPFVDLFDRLWTWSLTPESLESGTDADQQHAENTGVFFGNLHAHVHASSDGQLHDDGRPERHDAAGETVPVDIGDGMGAAARFAYRYARDEANLDFLAITPHSVDDREDDPADIASVSEQAYAALLDAAAEVTQASAGGFVAIAGVEWSTNSTGNHVGVLGTSIPAKVERGRFDLLYDEFLPQRTAAGDRPLVLLAHPRTFGPESVLEGAWDQIYGVSLSELPRSGERRQKFNDYGLDDYPPLSLVRESWIEGEALPDPAVVDETLVNMWEAGGPWVRLMEVTLGRGTEIGHENGQNPSLIEDEFGELVRRTRVRSDWDYYLLRGFRIAPVASHDNHLANWGTGHSSRTGVVADTLTQRNLYDALHRRRVFASEDENLEIRFYVDGRVPMGGELRTLASTVSARVHLRDPDHSGDFHVRVMSGRIGGTGVEVVREITTAGGWIELELHVSDPGESFFYVEVEAPSVTRMAWSAPIWVERLAG